MAELVSQRGDDGLAAPVLVIRGAGVRVPLTGAGVGNLDARPAGAGSDGEGELAAVIAGRRVADAVGDQVPAR